MQFLNYIKSLFKKSASSTSASADTPDQKHIVSKPSVPRQVTPKHKVPVKKIPSKQPVVETPVQKKVLPELQSKAKVGITKKKPLAITIGLDFGTSTTKCIVNLEGYEDGKDKFLAVAFPHKDYTEGVLCVPTAIGISGDSLVLGYDADILPEENVIRSFKMAIPCMNNDWGSYRSPYMIHDKPGYFKISGQGINAAGLSILYLSWLIRQIKTGLLKYLDEKYDPTFFLNMAAPLDQLIDKDMSVERNKSNLRNENQNEHFKRDARVSKYYRAVYQWSLKLSDQSRNPWRLQDAVAALKELSKSKILSEEETPTYVIPETVAAITAYVNRPRTRSGKFATFDVGAGTTDISYYWLEKQNGITKPWYYSSGSLHIGIDDIDRCLEDILCEEPGNSLRQKRQDLEQDKGLFRYRKILNGFFDKMSTQNKKMFGRAYGKEKRQRDWGTPNKAFITLLMLGGGCKIDVIKNLSSNKLWSNVIGSPEVDVLGLDLTEKVLMPDTAEVFISEVEAFSRQADLLVIAEGLAHKIIDIPEYGIQMNSRRYILKILEYDLFSGERKYVEKVIE